MERPVGVSVIAVLYFIAAAGLAVVALILLVGAGMLSRMMTQQTGMALMMGAGAVGAVVVAIIAACAVAVGWGLWSLRNWARIVAIVLSALAIAANVPGLFFLSSMHIGHGLWSVALIRLAVNGVIIWYLLQRDVGRAFGAAG